MSITERAQYEYKIRDAVHQITTIVDIFKIKKSIKNEKYSDVINKLYNDCQIELKIECNKSNKECKITGNKGIKCAYKAKEIEEDVKSRMDIEIYNYTYDDFINKVNIDNVEKLIVAKIDLGKTNVDDFLAIKRFLPKLELIGISDNDKCKNIIGYDNIEKYYKNKAISEKYFDTFKEIQKNLKYGENISLSSVDLSDCYCSQDVISDIEILNGHIVYRYQTDESKNLEIEFYEKNNKKLSQLNEELDELALRGQRIKKAKQFAAKVGQFFDDKSVKDPVIDVKSKEEIALEDEIYSIGTSKFIREYNNIDVGSLTLKMQTNLVDRFLILEFISKGGEYAENIINAVGLLKKDENTFSKTYDDKSHKNVAFDINRIFEQFSERYSLTIK